MSQLFVPGFRITSFGAFPNSPRFGAANAAVLNQRSNVLSPRGRIGFAVTHKRAPSPPPVRSGFPAIEYPIPLGVPLAKAVIPDNCQPSKTFRVNRLFQTRLALGKSQV